MTGRLRDWRPDGWQTYAVVEAVEDTPGKPDWACVVTPGLANNEWPYLLHDGDRSECHIGWAIFEPFEPGGWKMVAIECDRRYAAIWARWWGELESSPRLKRLCDESFHMAVEAMRPESAQPQGKEGV